MSTDRVDATGEIVRGKLTVRNQDAFRAHLRELRDGPVIITVRRQAATRSIEQNKLYWSTYVEPLAYYTGYSREWVHAYLKKRFLAANHIVIADADGVVVDEQDLEPTTTTLTKVEFSNYLSEIATFAETLGVQVGSSDGLL